MFAEIDSGLFQTFLCPLSKISVLYLFLVPAELARGKHARLWNSWYEREEGNVLRTHQQGTC